jgi:hypothetical protein
MTYDQAGDQLQIMPPIDPTGDGVKCDAEFPP